MILVIVVPFFVFVHRCGRTGRLGSREQCYVTNFVSSDRDVELVQKIEKSVRYSEVLPNVNGNITKVINNKIQKDIQRTQGLLDSIQNPQSMKR